MTEIRFQDLTLREMKVWGSGYADAIDDLQPQLDEAHQMCRDLSTRLENALADLEDRRYNPDWRNATVTLINTAIDAEPRRAAALRRTA